VRHTDTLRQGKKLKMNKDVPFQLRRSVRLTIPIKFKAKVKNMNSDSTELQAKEDNIMILIAATSKKTVRESYGPITTTTSRTMFCLYSQKGGSPWSND
jgi:hypothetical protein